MMDILNLVRREIARAAHLFNREMVGYIDSYNPNDHTAKVKFPTELDANGNPRITGWLPIEVAAGGALASWIIAPQVGDQATVSYLEGDSEGGKITGYLHNTVDTPPIAQSGEAILRHTKTGNYFKMSADGSFQHVHVATGNYAKVDASGNIIGCIKTPGQTWHYVGGDPKLGHGFDFILTPSGPSITAKARIT